MSRDRLGNVLAAVAVLGFVVAALATRDFFGPDHAGVLVGIAIFVIAIVAGPLVDRKSKP